MKIQIINKSGNKLPEYARKGDAGMDVRADFSNSVKEEFLFGSAWDDVSKCLRVFPGGRALIPTGLYTSFPKGFELQVRSRSGLALKQGVFVLNAPGTIDCNFKGELGVILMNLGEEDIEIYQGDRIAQIVLNKIEKISWEVVDELQGEDRGGGFGSTNIK
jgi:dUTP pyrophosphatase